MNLVPSRLAQVHRYRRRIENPAVGNSGTTVEVARERRRTVASELFPTVDLEGTYNYEKHNNGTLGTRRDYSLVVTSSWDLFTGFSTRSSMAQAAFDYHASKDQHEFTVRKVIEQSKLAWQALLTARERLELLENAVNIASEVFESRKKLREAGKETVINVLDAENEVNNAQINYTSAFYDERLAVYQSFSSPWAAWIENQPQPRPLSATSCPFLVPASMISKMPAPGLHPASRTHPHHSHVASSGARDR